MVLLQSWELQKIGQAADRLRRRKHPGNRVSFLLDRNINYTNVCVARCTFCNFYRKPKHDEGYLLENEQIFHKIEQTLSMGGTGILMQGGMNPASVIARSVQPHPGVFRYGPRRHWRHRAGHLPGRFRQFPGLLRWAFCSS